MVKDKKIDIRASVEEKRLVAKIAKHYKCESVAELFWQLVYSAENNIK